MRRISFAEHIQIDSVENKNFHFNSFVLIFVFLRCCLYCTRLSGLKQRISDPYVDGGHIPTELGTSTKFLMELQEFTFTNGLLIFPQMALSKDCKLNRNLQAFAKC